MGSSFFSSDQHYLAHASTDACDNVDGAPNLDSSLAFITSILFWYMLSPAIYTLASVCVPFGDDVPEEFRFEVKKKNEDRIEFIDDPLVESSERHLEAHGRVCNPQLADQLTRNEFEEIVKMFNEIDADSSGFIDQNEVEALFFKMGVTSSEEKTKKMFEAADIDGGGSIDFDEFCNFILMMKKEDQRGYDYLRGAFDETKRSYAQAFVRFLKLSSVLDPSLLMATVQLWWLNKLVAIFDGRPRFNWRQIIFSAYRRETEEERVAWVKQQEKAVPSYFDLCEKVFDVSGILVSF